MVLRKRLFSGDSSRLSLLAMLVGAMSAACPPPAPVDAGKDGEPDSTRSDVATETSASDAAGDVASMDVVSSDGALMDASSSDVVLVNDVVDSGSSADADSRADVSATVDVVDSGLALDAADSGGAGMDAAMSGDGSLPDVIVRDSSYTDVYRSADARLELCGSPLVSVPAGGSAEFDLTMALPSAEPARLPCIDPALAFYMPGQSYSYRLQIASPSQVTVVPSRGSVYGGVVHALARDCASSSPACLVAAQFPRIITEHLLPGTYEIQKWGAGGTTVYVEPPVSAPANTRCDTAVNIGLGSWTMLGPRVLDVQPRFARFRASTGPTGGRMVISVRSDGNNAYGTVVVRDGCGPTAAEIGRADNVPLYLSPLTVTVENNRDYFIEFSQITIGTRVSVMLERGV